jgi:hypothetical protein
MRILVQEGFRVNGFAPAGRSISRVVQRKLKTED